MARTDEIAARAYGLWDAAGCPDGRDQEFWFAAKASFRQVQGYLDQADRKAISGWMMDRADPSDRVVLQLARDGVVIATTEASRYRVDLERAQIGDGRYGFLFDLTQVGDISGKLQLLIEGSPAPLSQQQTDKLGSLF